MNLKEYREVTAGIPYGKRLPTALYLLRDAAVDLGAEITQLVSSTAAQLKIKPEFNVLKFRTDDLKISFLHYPAFHEVAHPCLRSAVTVDLRSGKARFTDYSANLNPPILHRKENLLPAGDPRRSEFEALTRQEEKAGLFENPATIGFKLNWERLLNERQIRIVGHRLERATAPSRPDVPDPISSPVHRHKTALKRYDLSKPVKSLLEHGLLTRAHRVFDYGCGQGSDVQGLRALGYEVTGWDPVFEPHSPKSHADIVNLGYVLNVIEDPAERLTTLVDAYRHAERLLVISALISETVDRETADVLGDGVLTKRKTFQKYYDQAELHQYIEDALETSAGEGVKL